MLKALLDRLVQDDLAFDSKSLLDTLWLARVMSNASVGRSTNSTLAAPKDDAPREYTLADEAAEEASDKHHDDDSSDETDDELSETAQHGEAMLTTAGPAGSDGGGYLGSLPTLPDPNGFRRAMKPLLRCARTASSKLDEAATIAHFLRSGARTLLPILRKGSRRSLKLSLVIDPVGSNSLWSQSLDELERLLRLQGTFRQLNRWSLRLADDASPGSSGEAQLRPLDRNGLERGASRAAAPMIWWPKEIIVIASDFTSEGWWSGAYPKLLKRWAAQQPVLLLHTLPPRLWARTWTASPDAIASVLHPLSSCNSMEVRPVTLDEASFRDVPGLALPVAALDARSLGIWAHALAGDPVGMPAVFVDSRAASLAPLETDSTEPDAQYLCTAFRMGSSPLARKLAQYMSVTAPLSFPVMRWVQQAMLPESDASHLAEFVLGGLLVQSAGDASSPADSIAYDFADNVRLLLQQGMTISHAMEVQYAVGTYLEAHHTEELDLRAAVRTWSDAELASLPQGLKSFAVVSRQFLERVGLRPRSDAAHAVNTVPTPKVATASRAIPSASSSAAPRQEAIDTAGVAREVLASAEAPPLSVRRELRQRILDLQWSALDPDVLATLTESGVEVWNPQHERAARRIDLGMASRPPAGPPIVLHWWLPEDGKKAEDTVRIARGLARRVADALTASGERAIRVRRLRHPASLPNRIGDLHLLLAFETEASTAWALRNPAQIAELEHFAMQPGVICTAVQLGDVLPLHTAAQFRVMFQSALEATEGSDKAGLFANLLGDLARYIRSVANHPQENNVRGRRVSAISWMTDGRLGIAEFNGLTNTIRAIDVRDAESRTTVRGDLIAAFDNELPITTLYQVRDPDTSAQTSSSAKMRDDAAFACLDEDGNLAVASGRTRDAPRMPGYGLPRRGMRPGFSSNWGVTDDENGIVTFSVDEKQPLGNVRLTPRIAPYRRMLRDLLEDFACDDVLVTWSRDDTIFALTAQGRLHRGSMHDALRERTARASPLDPDPKRLNGTLLAAAASADGEHFAILKSTGDLELWNIDADEPLGKWKLPAVQLAAKPLSLALSSDGRFIAFGMERSLFVREAPKRALDLRHWTRNLLWVDDRPQNNELVRAEFAGLGVRSTLALSTKEALELLSRRRFAAVISDMGRAEGPSEGYVLLETMRRQGNLTPYFIFAGSDLQAHRDEALARGAQGSTNDWRQLVDEVMAYIGGNNGSHR